MPLCGGHEGAWTRVFVSRRILAGPFKIHPRTYYEEIEDFLLAPSGFASKGDYAIFCFILLESRVK
jgi:hypothetical protein